MTPRLPHAILGLNPVVSAALIFLAFAVVTIVWLALEARRALVRPDWDDAIHTARRADVAARARVGPSGLTVEFPRRRLRVVVGAVDVVGDGAAEAFGEPWPVDRPFRYAPSIERGRHG